MSHQLKKNINIRAGHRAVVTKSLKKVDELMADYDENNESNLRGVDKILREKLETLKIFDENILSESELDPDGLGTEIEQASDITERINVGLFKIEKCLKKSGESELNTSLSTTLSTSMRNKKGVSLPKLELRKFSGDPKTWQSWWDGFKSSIHENEDLTDIDRFNYLRSLLQGAASHAILGLGLSSDNYNEAIEILQARFGKKLVVISSHMDALMKTSSIKSIQDTRGLRNLYDRVESHIRALNVMGVGSKSYGCLLVPVIMSRLPEELKLILTRTLDPDADAWEMDDLLREFEKEVEARERVAHVTAGETQVAFSSAQKNGARHEKSYPAAAGLLATEAQEAGCIFCSGKHSAASCTVVCEIASRREIVLKAGRCFVCLGSGHIARKCKSKKKCMQCQRRHHRSLCEGLADKTDGDVESTCIVAEQSAGGAAEGSECIAAEQSECIAAVQMQNEKSMLVKSQTRSLLMTATVNASTVGGATERVVARVVLDGGSHKSYVTSKLQKKLGLRNIGTKILNVGTSGRRRGRLRRRKRFS